MTRGKVLPPVYFLFALLAMGLLHGMVPVLHVLARPINLVGFLPFLAGIVLILLSVRVFGRLGTTVKPFQESSRLATDGPYRFTRNPMYLGMALILLGIALALGTVTPLLVVPLFMLLMTVKFIRVEETMLAAKFGDEYQQYKTRVRRWI